MLSLITIKGDKSNGTANVLTLLLGDYKKLEDIYLKHLCISNETLNGTIRFVQVYTYIFFKHYLLEVT